MTQPNDTTEQEIAEQVKAMLAMDPDQRRAIVAACTTVIEAVTQRNALVIVSRSDTDDGYLLRTHAWGTDGSADVADMLMQTATNIAAQAIRQQSEVLQ